MISCLQVFAAPHPVTASSQITDPEKKHSYSIFGFLLSTNGTVWKPNYPLTHGAQPEFRFDNQLSPNKSSFVTVNIDELEKTSSLENYGKKWIKDYNQFGFEVLGSKSLEMGGGPALMFDLYQKEKGKQQRQVIFQNNRKIVLITCTDNKEDFSKSLANCNELIKSFSWLK